MSAPCSTRKSCSHVRLVNSIVQCSQPLALTNVLNELLCNSGCLAAQKNGLQGGRQPTKFKMCDKAPVNLPRQQQVMQRRVINRVELFVFVSADRITLTTLSPKRQALDVQHNYSKIFLKGLNFKRKSEKHAETCLVSSSPKLITNKTASGRFDIYSHLKHVSF